MFSLKKRSHALRSKLNKIDAQMANSDDFPFTLIVKSKGSESFDGGRLRWEISHPRCGMQV